MLQVVISVCFDFKVFLWNAWERRSELLQDLFMLSEVRAGRLSAAWTPGARPSHGPRGALPPPAGAAAPGPQGRRGGTNAPHTTPFWHLGGGLFKWTEDVSSLETGETMYQTVFPTLRGA